MRSHEPSHFSGLYFVFKDVFATMLERRLVEHKNAGRVHPTSQTERSHALWAMRQKWEGGHFALEGCVVREVDEDASLQQP